MCPQKIVYKVLRIRIRSFTYKHVSFVGLCISGRECDVNELSSPSFTHLSSATQCPGTRTYYASSPSSHPSPEHRPLCSRAFNAGQRPHWKQPEWNNLSFIWFFEGIPLDGHYWLWLSRPCNAANYIVARYAASLWCIITKVITTRFGPKRVAADMEENGEFDFWEIY